MRKILIVLTVLVLFVSISPAMAQKVKIPKLLCIELTSQGEIHQLAFKRVGRIMDKGATVTTYTITGCDQFTVISGSGYIIPGSTTLHATYNGQYELSGSTHRLCSYELFFNLTTNSGEIRSRFDFEDGTRGTLNSLVEIKNCSTVSIPRP